MEHVIIDRKDGGCDAIPIYTWDTLPLDDMPVHISSKGYGSQKIGYLADFATFDIETTSMVGKYTYVTQGKGSKAKRVKQWSVKPWGFMYHWQFCFNGHVCFGRRWEEFFKLLDRLIYEYHLKDLKRLVIYVHNLGFEFTFLYPFLEEYIGKWQLFATGTHTPVKVTGERGIEFRCSWKLTNMNLYMFTKTEKDCPYLKPYGDLDYKKIRTADTPLSDKEKGYCCVDVLGLYHAIHSRMKADHDTIATIPLTSTGYPRRDTRRACRKDPNYREKIYKKCVLTYNVYRLLVQMRRGGDTHASRFYSSKLWEDVFSYDYVSLYPAMLLLELFPIERFSRYGAVESLEELEKLTTSGLACIFTVYFEDLEVNPDEPMPYIPIDKLVTKPGKKYIHGDNGRVIKVDGICSLTVNEIDWEIIKKSYHWKPGLIITDMHTARKGRIPEPIRRVILAYFAQKCQLKEEINDTEDLLEKDPANKTLIDRLNDLNYRYTKIKNKLNGIFGMMYTDPVREAVTMNERGEWKEQIPEGSSEEQLLEKAQKSRNSFLVYAWGPWVTSHARLALRKLQACAKDPDSARSTVIYSDTDSAKSQVWDEKALDDLIKAQKEKSDEMGAYWDSPKTGKRYYMGYPELDGHARRFITLGAKKYAYEDKKGQLHVTVSGVSNTHAPGDELGAGARELMERGGLDAFKVGFIFQDAGGQTVWYGHDDPHYVTVNGCRMLTASYAALSDGEYTLGQTEEYKRLLGAL